MKLLNFAIAMTLSFTMGCVATADAPSAEPVETSAAQPTAELTSTTTEQLTLTPAAAAASCHGAEQTCLSAFNCHHEEGRNIGQRGCPTAQICCQF